MNTFEIGVRDLVTYVLRSGSIDSRTSGKSRMHEGTLFHQQIQEHDKKVKDDYQSEVFFSHNLEYDDYLFKLSGRADAMYREDGETVIEEIKTTRRKKSEDFKADFAHLTQLRFYGYFYLLENDLDQINLRLHYYHINSDESTYFDETLTKNELRAYIESILNAWLELGSLRYKWIEKRDKTIKKVPFIFNSFRRGQREMSLAVYNTIKRDNEVLIEAPTGIGKTVASLFPSIKSLPSRKGYQIYYLTSKTTIQNEARKALDKMRELGLSIRSTTLTAKDKICFLNQEEPGSRRCNPDDCKFAKGYFDKLNAVLIEALNTEENYTREYIEKIAFKNEICPFEFTMELANWSDIIIGDYNYAFDPVAKIESLSPDRIYLIDEAHNLTDRAREMYSTNIELQKLLDLLELIDFEKADFRDACRNYKKHLKRMINCLKDLREKLKPDENILELDEDEYAKFSKTLQELQISSLWLYTKLEKKNIKASQDFQLAYDEIMTEVYKFNLLLDYYEKNREAFHIYLKRQFGGILVRLACLDPSKFIKESIAKNAAVLFSATLTPFDYYKRILLNSEDVPSIAIPSPFNREKCLILNDDTISTRYVDREDSIEKIAQRIVELTESKKGHYIAFFPSYVYLKLVQKEVEKSLSKDYKILVQQNNMDDQEREEFINHFKEDKTPILGLCVMGGIFSEGLDLPLDSLIGTVIIGPGLPGLDYERDLLKDYFEEINDHGYAYAYAYPGMNRVLQSAGRVIRTEDDQGVILLIDDRFGTSFYNKMIPEHLKPESLSSKNEDVSEILNEFWTKQKLL